MNKSPDLDNSEDDVVVIEERDKRSYLYIAIAGVLGLALGGWSARQLPQTNGKQPILSCNNSIKPLNKSRSN
ncbi:UPF0325 protein YaeH [Vibrio ponticus]|nr:UPF0325 protein YaeH [Vibrio ponticus]